MITGEAQCMDLKRIKFWANQFKNLLIAAKWASKERGIRHVLSHAIVTIYDILCYLLIYLRSCETFYFQGQMYKYFFHWYNHTWKNERCIEIPIVLRKYYEAKVKGKRILEVGNVLSHYIPCNHDIVDKYEKLLGVINQDIVDFRPQKKYDLILSISTLEHVGWDEEKKNPNKILQALDNMKALLADRGEMIVTLPLGYNPHVDRLLAMGEIKFDHLFYFKRVSGKWIETNCLDDAELVIGIIEKRERI
jgi:SAM-dependent methyltransferase